MGYCAVLANFIFNHSGFRTIGLEVDDFSAFIITFI